ncbi:hypothetical protein V6N11_061755 [Hibiscus sabdariffa]|uniref:Uncharacterized protein n=1 Tax=Hibiscus sabdariffa TaxID=183260 RepID=A0ABR2AC83_9ROSI
MPAAASDQAPFIIVVTDQESLAAIAVDLAEPTVVSTKSTTPFDMVGSTAVALALVFDSDDGDVSNVDPILLVLRNDAVLVLNFVVKQGKATSSIIVVDGQSNIPLIDNPVDPLLDFEAWLDQPPQASNFEVNGGNDEKVLVLMLMMFVFINRVWCCLARSMLRDIVRRLPLLSAIGNLELR